VLHLNTEVPCIKLSLDPDHHNYSYRHYNVNIKRVNGPKVRLRKPESGCLTRSLPCHGSPPRERGAWEKRGELGLRTTDLEYITLQMVAMVCKLRHENSAPRWVIFTRFSLLRKARIIGA
jgi:hypothetical protein